jgi:hypothetical protein
LGIRRASCWVQSSVASGAFLVSLILRAATAYSSKNGGGQARDLVGNQGQAAPPFLDPALEVKFVGGQRLQQESAVQRHGHDLLAQLFDGAAAAAVLRLANLHEGDRHFLQIGDVLFQVLERVLDLQRKQAAQPGAVFGTRHVGLVKHLDGDGVDRVDQRRIANQGLAAFLNFEQLGQLAKGPCGVALACQGAAEQVY